MLTHLKMFRIYLCKATIFWNPLRWITDRLYPCVIVMGSTLHCGVIFHSRLLSVPMYARRLPSMIDTAWMAATKDDTVYPKKYAHGFCFAVLCWGYTLTDYPISIRLTSLALRQSNDCPSASKATLMNMDKYFMWVHYERLHNHNKAKHNKTVCTFLGICCTWRESKLHWVTTSD